MKRIIHKLGAVFTRALPLLLALFIAAAPFSTAVRAESAQESIAVSYTQQYNSVLNYLYSSGAPVYGSIGGEWKVFALARSGRLQPDSNYASAYYSQIERMVREAGSGRLDSTKSTENSRVIIALTSIGRDARSVAGYDLTYPLSDFDYVRRQGINGAIFALIALNSNSAYGMSSLKTRCIDFILEREIPGGGWALAGNNPDPDVTAMAITALANYSAARDAVNRGIRILSEMQDANGGFSSFGTACSESCSQVMVALSAMNIDAGSDSRFTKNGKSVVDALLSFFTGTGFSHTIGGVVNGMASEQAAYALCAYDRFLRGRNTLFNMNDVDFSHSPIEPPITMPPTPTPEPTPTPTPRPTPTPTPTPTPSPTPRPTPTPTPRPTPTPTPRPTPTPTPRPTPTPTPRPTPTPTPRPTPTPTASIPSDAPTDIPTDIPTGIPTDDPTPELTEEPSVTPELSDEPTEEPTPEVSDTPEPTETPDPADTPPADTPEPTEVPDVTFDPIDITGSDWKGNNSIRREKLKWLIPVGIGGILLVAGIFLIISSRKRDQ